MKQTKNIKKRSLVVSIVVLAACFASFIGATFAWFTDTSSSGVNSIDAGTLRVAILGSTDNSTWECVAGIDSDGNETGRSLKVKKYATDSSYVPMDSSVIWEPGDCYESETLKFKNTGSLALSYETRLVLADAYDLDNNELCEVIEVFISKNNGDYISLGTLSQITKKNCSILQTGNYLCGGLAPGVTSSETWKLKFKMADTPDTKYQGITFPGFKLVVDAKQLSQEYDSYNNSYDADSKSARDLESKYSYLTFSSDSEFTLSNSGGSGLDLYYSTDLSSWSAWANSTEANRKAVLNSSDNKYYIYLRGENRKSMTINTIKLLTTVENQFIDCQGNIMSLLDSEDPESVRMDVRAFQNLFSGCTALRSAPSLPAKTLSNYCYSGMFQGCVSLASAPELPATKLTQGCYLSMFSNCTSLVTAPELSATKLAASCYEQMFTKCTSLTTAPKLPATVLADSCYKCMFKGCTNLTTAPSELPALSLKASCYYQMFSECSSLVTAPNILATEVATYSCCQMFYSCESLTQAPAYLKASQLAEGCYEDMFLSCASLVKPPVIAATSFAKDCCRKMFCWSGVYKANSFKTTGDSSQLFFTAPSDNIDSYCHAMFFSKDLIAGQSYYYVEQ